MSFSLRRNYHTSIPTFLESLFVMICIFHSCFCIDTDTITAGIVLKDPNTLVSRGKVYRLGFFSPVNTTKRYLAIWNDVSSTSIIWVANRDKPLNDSSGAVMISENGNLVLTNGRNEIIWSSGVLSLSRNAIVQILDSGNLILTDTSNGSKIWESFRHPGDAFLPTLKLTYNTRTRKRDLLTSWKSPVDPDFGNFSAGLDALVVPQIFIWNGSQPHWRSGWWNGQIFTGVTDMYAVYLDGYSIVRLDDGSVSFTRDFYGDILMKIILKSNGSFVQTMWDVNRKEWNVTWVAPVDDCDFYGKCGTFGNCNLQNKPMCTCLKGYKPKNKQEWDKGNWADGCERKTPLQCDRSNYSSDKSKEDVFLKLKNVKVPDFLNVLPGVVNDCRGLCLRNCSCIAYSYDNGIGCMFWGGNLTDVRQFPIGGSDFYVRVAYSELGKEKDRKPIIIILSVAGLVIVFVSIFLLWRWMAKRKEAKRKQKILAYGADPALRPVDSSSIVLRADMDEVSIDELPFFSLEVLANATNGFSEPNLLGKGGFGSVYKGKLANGKEIAVKRLSRASGQGMHEFMNEVVVISKLQHRNLVSILGCFVDKEEKMLVYEYMINRSLDMFLFDASQKILDWQKRFNIIQGIGRGLLYLHRDSRLKIIHRDLKPSNILLDENWNPKISDFGMARIFGGDEDQAHTRRVVGTYGYMAPEFAMGGRFSEKSDVFSFGVLVLEIITGRRNTSFYNDELSLSLLGYAWELWNEHNAVDIIDERISSPSHEAEIMRCIQIGLLCVQELPISRPTISHVLSLLTRETVDLLVPEKPGFNQNLGYSQIPSSSSHSHTTGSSNKLSITVLDGR